MAKNDYFVVVYRILSRLLESFMMGEAADPATFGPDALGIPNGYWANVMESLLNEGYVTGVSLFPRLGAAPDILLRDPKITQKGILFLQENSSMAKARDFLRGLKEIIPGL